LAGFAGTATLVGGSSLVEFRSFNGSAIQTIKETHTMYGTQAKDGATFILTATLEGISSVKGFVVSGDFTLAILWIIH
jgi:hypothetical protein